jgi:hypothetical protein
VDAVEIMGIAEDDDQQSKLRTIDRVIGVYPDQQAGGTFKN